MQMQGYLQQEPEEASYFEMHVTGCYIVDQQEDDSEN